MQRRTIKEQKLQITVKVFATHKFLMQNEWCITNRITRDWDLDLTTITTMSKTTPSRIYLRENLAIINAYIFFDKFYFHKFARVYEEILHFFL